MSGKCIIGIDLGGTNLKLALFDFSLSCLAKRSLSTRQFKNKKSLLAAIINSILGVIAEAGLKKTEILGIGIGVPGPVDHKKGIVHFLPNVPGWRNAPLKALLQKALRLPVFLDNDAKLMGLAEYELGAARGNSHCLCITLGTGVGGAIILGGNIYRGARNAAGEIGHFPLNERGLRCNCGGIACLESYIGNSRILALAKKIFKAPISLEELSYLAKKKEARALSIWSAVGEHLGTALAGAVNLLDLNCIVIGGGVSNAGEFLFEVVKRTLNRRLLKVLGRKVKVLKARLGSDAGIIGAAIMVRRNI